jgi:hypothetical protein
MTLNVPHLPPETPVEHFVAIGRIDSSFQAVSHVQAVRKASDVIGDLWKIDIDVFHVLQHLLDAFDV